VLAREKGAFGKVKPTPTLHLFFDLVTETAASVRLAK